MAKAEIKACVADVPSMLLPLVIFIEVLASIVIIVGWQAHWFALALSDFTLFDSLLFHLDLSNQMQAIIFTKNPAIAGVFFWQPVPGVDVVQALIFQSDLIFFQLD